MDRVPLRPRAQLNKDGKRHLHEQIKKATKRYKYADVNPIQAQPTAVWLIASDLGEQKLYVTCPDMRIEQLVDIVKCEGWRKKFTVMMLDAGVFNLQPGQHHYYSPDSRKVNQNGEVVL